MVQQKASKPRLVRRRRKPAPEEVWVKAFVEYTGTVNVSAFDASQLHEVSLTRIIEALRRGSMTWTTKCSVGAICAFEHMSDDDEVEVVVWFEANQAKLEIREARRIVKEDDSEPNAA